jgi:hypothetical protein
MKPFYSNLPNQTSRNATLKRACLEITNYKSQITNKLQTPMTKITNSDGGLLRAFQNLNRISKRFLSPGL